MCRPDALPLEEIYKLPELIRASGWVCSEVENASIQGSSGPSKKIRGITVYQGIDFSITARRDDFKVRIGWPGELTTTISVYTATQVIFWLGKMMEVALQDREFDESNT